MSKMSELVNQLATVGVVTKEVSIGEMKVALRILDVEEQLIAESLIKNDALRKKYGLEQNEFRTMNDTLAKYRTVSTLCFAIASINGIVPVEKELLPNEQFKQRLDFLDDLMNLNVTMIDTLMAEYTKLAIEHRKFFENLEEVAGK